MGEVREEIAAIIAGFELPDLKVCGPVTLRRWIDATKRADAIIAALPSLSQGVGEEDDLARAIEQLSDDATELEGDSDDLAWFEQIAKPRSATRLGLARDIRTVLAALPQQHGD